MFSGKLLYSHLAVRIVQHLTPRHCMEVVILSGNVSRRLTPELNGDLAELV